MTEWCGETVFTNLLCSIWAPFSSLWIYPAAAADDDDASVRASLNTHDHDTLEGFLTRLHDGVVVARRRTRGDVWFCFCFCQTALRPPPRYKGTAHQSAIKHYLVCIKGGAPTVATEPEHTTELEVETAISSRFFWGVLLQPPHKKQVKTHPESQIRPPSQ